ncbi:hypothetical protein [Leclercia sp.]|uniref:hypothetical protein n=1 Tax=Leclercia sp. TaxID=1898428 RepID=UPI0028A5CC9B|nr:hypothetical protein [Leclercia sp.]
MDNSKAINDILKQLKTKRFSKDNFIGLIVCILLNKDIFSYNQEVSKFIKLSFDLNLPLYAVRSRTLMVAKICRYLFKFNEKEIERLRTKVYINLTTALADKLNSSTNLDGKSKNNKNDALSNMNKWIGGILKKDN